MGSGKPKEVGLHKYRLHQLLRYLIDNEAVIKVDGTTYQAKPGRDQPNIKDLVLQATNMEDVYSKVFIHIRNRLHNKDGGERREFIDQLRDYLSKYFEWHEDRSPDKLFIVV